MKESKAAVMRGLKKLAKANKVLTNENAAKIFDFTAKSIDLVSRKDLLDVVEVHPSTLSEYLSGLEAADLFLLSQTLPNRWERYERYQRRNQFIKISPYGRRLSDVMGSPVPLKFTYVASDLNRILVLNTITESEPLAQYKDGISFNDIYDVVNGITKRHKIAPISTALLSYHLRILRKEEQMTVTPLYQLTSDGRSTVKKIVDIVGYRI